MAKPGIMNRRIPTLLGLVILITGLVAGIALVNRRTSLESKAGPTESPKNIKLSNISATGFSVNWATDTPMTGYIKYSEDPAKINLPAGDVRDQISGTSQNYTNHYVNITGLGPNKTYYFNIGSGSQTYSDNNKPFQVRTWVQANTPPEDVVNGKVVTTEGGPVSGAIVLLDIEGGETLSTITKNDGTWRINLASVRDKAGKVLTYDPKTAPISIFIQAGAQGTATAVTNTEKARPVPDIVIGRNQSFVEGQGIMNTLANSMENEATRTAAFQLAEASTTDITENNPIKMIYPAIDGELVATDTPEIRGTMLPNSSLKIKVGELEGNISVGEDGTWKWSPTTALTSGNQTINLSYIDAQERELSLTRNFVVVAMGNIGGLPAFTATPSATPEMTPTPTEVTTMPETDNPDLEKTGAVEMTLGAITIGLLLIWSGRYLKKKME